MENLWCYEVLGTSWGVVIAETKEEAEQKVREYYRKHSDWYKEHFIVDVSKPEVWGRKFSDTPDVIEVYP